MHVRFAHGNTRIHTYRLLLLVLKEREREQDLFGGERDRKSSTISAGEVVRASGCVTVSSHSLTDAVVGERELNGPTPRAEPDASPQYPANPNRTTAGVAHRAASWAAGACRTDGRSAGPAARGLQQQQLFFPNRERRGQGRRDHVSTGGGWITATAPPPHLVWDHTYLQDPLRPVAAWRLHFLLVGKLGHAEDPEAAAPPRGGAVGGERWLHQRDAISIIGDRTTTKPTQQHSTCRAAADTTPAASLSLSSPARHSTRRQEHPPPLTGGGNTRGHGHVGAATVLRAVAGVGRGVYQGGAGRGPPAAGVGGAGGGGRCGGGRE